MDIVQDGDRINSIKKLYKNILGREADKPGLESYLKSPLSLEEIERDIKASPEYLKRKVSESFSDTLAASNSSDLLLLGSSPTERKHIEELKRIGVKAVLDLNTVSSNIFSSAGFESYKHVALMRNAPISVNKVNEILDFIFTSLFTNKHKLFIHSELGMNRAPIAVALFLVADRGINFYDAVKVVVHKHNNVNPNKNLVTHSTLEAAKAFKGNTGTSSIGVVAGKAPSATSVGIVKLSDNLFVCSDIDQQSISENRITVLYNLNQDRVTRLPSGVEEVHIPVSTDSVSMFMPAIIKSSVKRSKQEKVLVFSYDVGMIMFYAESVLRHNNELNNAVPVGRVRAKILSVE